MKKYVFAALLVVPCLYVPYAIAIRPFLAWNKFSWFDLIYLPGWPAALFIPNAALQVCAAFIATACMLIVLVWWASDGVYSAIAAAITALVISVPLARLWSSLKVMFEQVH